MSKAAIGTVSGGTTKIRCLNDRIAVEYIEHPKTSKGGIVLPDNAKDLKDRPLRGKVIATGDGIKLRGPDGDYERDLRVSVGQTILYTLYAGSEHVIDGKKVCFTLESEVVAILDEE